MGFFDSELGYPTARSERAKHKKHRLVQGPNSFFMDVKCPSCNTVNQIYSHATTVVNCKNCKAVLSRPTGGKAKLVEGCSFRKKADH
jgi:small subunit ribosomal protein S27e